MSGFPMVSHLALTIQNWTRNKNGKTRLDCFKKIFLYLFYTHMVQLGDHLKTGHMSCYQTVRYQNGRFQLKQTIWKPDKSIFWKVTVQCGDKGLLLMPDHLVLTCIFYYSAPQRSIESLHFNVYFYYIKIMFRFKNIFILH